MKYMHFYILATLFLISCEFRDPIEVNQITSNDFVTILPNQKKDSISICLPLEFEISTNTSKIRYITWHYYVNNRNRFLDDFFDYQVYIKNKTKPIHRLTYQQFNQSLDKSIKIILKEREHYISKKEVQELFKKYKVNKSLDNLKLSDTIKLATYDKFRTENKSIITALNKISDSINFRVMKEDGSFFYLNKKIEW